MNKISMMKRKSWRGGSLRGFRLTNAERAAGRLLRAPDHDSGTGGDSGDGNGDGGEGADGDGAGVGASGEGAGAAAAASVDGGDQAPGADDKGQAADAAAGDGAGAGDKTILGAAADGDDGDGSDDGSDGDAVRTTFGEGEAAASILGAPEAYELTVPEELAAAGMEFDKEAFSAVEADFRDLNLSNDAAQKIVAAYASKVLPLIEKRGADGADALGADMKRTWASDAAKQFDGKEGRAALGEVKALCKQAFLGAGVQADSPFLTLMEESGLGSHPDMIRTIAFFGRMMGEASIDASSGGGGSSVRMADKIYGRPEPRA